MSFQGKGKGDLAAVHLKHRSGSTATIYRWGATLTSYITADGAEKIFVSPGAVFDGKKAIRGGVPVVFPQFGQPDKAMPQHGFARTSTWTMMSLEDTAEHSRLVLQLTANKDTLSVWPFKFELEYTVELSAVSLKMTLAVMNVDSNPFNFQALLHTYFLIPQIGEVAVRGLGGRTYIDKVADGALKPQDKTSFQK